MSNRLRVRDMPPFAIVIPDGGPVRDFIQNLFSQAVKMLEIGMKIKTNYSDEPCWITQIDRDCTCPSYIDEIEMEEPPQRRPHIHLVLENRDGKKRWLNGYDEQTLMSIDKSYLGGKTHLDHDRIIVLTNDRTIQQRLFQ